jgi:hypothetical protein
MPMCLPPSSWSVTPSAGFVHHYSQRFPDEVSGLLLLDPAHQDYNA